MQRFQAAATMPATAGEAELALAELKGALQREGRLSPATPGAAAADTKAESCPKSA